jgi:hypothetical protein
MAVYQRAVQVVDGLQRRHRDHLHLAHSHWENQLMETYVHLPTGKTCTVLLRRNDMCFCNFGLILNPFCWVYANELQEVSHV